MYIAVDNIQILVIFWDIIKHDFSIYYKVFCIIITCIWDVAYSSGHFDVLYVIVGQNIQPEIFRENRAMLTDAMGLSSMV